MYLIDIEKKHFLIRAMLYFPCCLSSFFKYFFFLTDKNGNENFEK